MVYYISMLSTTGGKLKISAKKLDIIALNPYPINAQAACSRLDPHPKLSPATSTDPEYLSLFKAKLVLGAPSSTDATHGPQTAPHGWRHLSAPTHLTGHTRN